MKDPLRHGLRRHGQIINELRYFSVDRERLIKIGRMIDELVAAVTVQHLEMPPENQEQQRKAIRAAFEPRWTEEPF